MCKYIISTLHMATQAQEKISLALTNICPQLATNALAITFSEMQCANDDGNSRFMYNKIGHSSSSSSIQKSKTIVDLRCQFLKILQKI